MHIKSYFILRCLSTPLKPNTRFFELGSNNIPLFMVFKTIKFEHIFFKTHFHQIKFSQKIFKIEQIKYRVEEIEEFKVFVFVFFFLLAPLKQTPSIELSRIFNLAPPQLKLLVFYLLSFCHPKVSSSLSSFKFYLHPFSAFIP